MVLMAVGEKYGGRLEAFGSKVTEQSADFGVGETGVYDNALSTIGHHVGILLKGIADKAADFHMGQAKNSLQI